MHRRAHVSALVIIAALVSACERNWPPNSQWVEDYFHENRDDLETLVAAIADSEYQGVTSPDREAIYVHTYANTDSNDIMVSRLLIGEDAANWLELLLAAGVPEVRKLPGGPIVAEASHLIGRPSDVYWRGLYWYEPDHGSGFAECRNKYREAPCGNCGIQLNDNWWLSFQWTPMSLHEEKTRELAESPDGELSDALEDRFLECFYDGTAIIDYVGDVP